MTHTNTPNVLANGKITIQNINTGEHRTFCVLTQSETSKFAPGKRTVSLLTGPDNETDYMTFAFVGNDDRLNVWRKYSAKPTEKPSSFDWYSLMFGVLVTQTLDDGTHGIRRADYEVLEERRCIKCDRTLTDPESIRLGIGPKCRGDI